MTIQMSNSIEDLKTLSLLDNRIHHAIANDGKMYTSFSGIIIPYNIGVSIILWSLTNSQVHLKLLDDKKTNKLIRKLNPTYEKFFEKNIKIVPHIIRKFTTLYLESYKNNRDDLSNIIY